MTMSDSVSGPPDVEAWDETVDWNGLALCVYGPDPERVVVSYVRDANYLRSQINEWVGYGYAWALDAYACLRIPLHLNKPCAACLQRIVDHDEHAREIHKLARKEQWKNRHDRGCGDDD